ncbi:MAG TPA: YbaB/EbfC family nucleoid-associated protein [Waddliaceae bacterium]
MGTGFAKKKKQARMMQDQLRKFQEQMQHSEATGTAGNGLVTITLSGEQEMKKIVIKPDCVDPEDIEGLQDLIKAAHNDAIKQLREQAPEMDDPGSMLMDI